MALALLAFVGVVGGGNPAAAEEAVGGVTVTVDEYAGLTVGGPLALSGAPGFYSGSAPLYIRCNFLYTIGAYWTVPWTVTTDNAQVWCWPYGPQSPGISTGAVTVMVTPGTGSTPSAPSAGHDLKATTDVSGPSEHGGTGTVGVTIGRSP